MGTASLILGIIGMCLIWITFIAPFSVLYLFIHLPLGILAIIFGSISYWRKKQHDIYGLTGLILGIIIIIAGFIFMMISILLVAAGNTAWSETVR